jgi:predicted transcriptional regulator
MLLRSSGANLKRLADRTFRGLLNQRSKGLLATGLTHDELAAMVGASRPRVSLALKQLERRGFLVRRGKEIRVQEKPLRAYLEERYGFVF